MKSIATNCCYGKQQLFVSSLDQSRLITDEHLGFQLVDVTVCQRCLRWHLSRNDAITQCHFSRKEAEREKERKQRWN